jgi:hypothetical protein
VNYPPLGEHWIIVSDDEMLDELSRRLAGNLSRAIEASLTDLTFSLNEVAGKLGNFIATLREVVRLLEEQRVIKTNEPPDDLIN